MHIELQQLLKYYIYSLLIAEANQSTYTYADPR
jgi:hypothetical protein